MSKFSYQTITKLVEELVGGIRPIGETNYDQKCFENIWTLDHVVSELVDNIQLMIPYKDSYEASKKAIGDYAVDFVKRMKINIDEWIEEYNLTEGMK